MTNPLAGGPEDAPRKPDDPQPSPHGRDLTQLPMGGCPANGREIKDMPMGARSQTGGLLPVQLITRGTDARGGHVRVLRSPRRAL